MTCGFKMYIQILNIHIWDKDFTGAHANWHAKVCEVVCDWQVAIVNTDPPWSPFKLPLIISQGPCYNTAPAKIWSQCIS